MTGPQGLCIDLDGTLAESLHVMRSVYGRFLEQHGSSARNGEFEQLNGPPLTEIVSRLKRSHGLTAPEEVLLADYRKLIADAYVDVQPAEGADVLLRAARTAGWSTVVVTSNTSELTHAWLIRTGLAPLIDKVVGCEMVTRGKPFPDPYVAAVPAGSSAKDSVAVEDSRQGAQAALSAGLRTFFFDGGGGPTAAVDELRGIEGIVHRLDQLVEVLF